MPDECDTEFPDWDGDGKLDGCDDDLDDDGFLNYEDECPYSDVDLPVNDDGGPFYDMNSDCAVTTDEYYWYFLGCIDNGGPANPISCNDQDADGSGTVDLYDFALFQRSASPQTP